MARNRITVDMKYLMVALLQMHLNDSGEYPYGVEVVAGTDVDTVERLPMVIVQPGQGTMIPNGGPSLAWAWTVSVQVLHEDEELCGDLADHVYELMHTFHDKGSGIPDVGVVTGTEDISMPSHTATTATPAGGITQFDGAWTVTVQKA